MAHDAATAPLPRATLRLLPGSASTEDNPAQPVPVPDPVPSTGTEPAAVLVPTAAVTRITPAERAALAAQSYATELWTGPGALLHSLRHGKAETLAQHRAYIKSRDWVPGDLNGTRARNAITVLGLVYHWLIGQPLKALAKAIKFAAEKTDEAAERPLRLIGLLAPLLAIVLILIYL